MATTDKCCTIVPYFEVPAENLEQFKSIAARCVAQTQSEPKCLYYGFSFSGNVAHCREGTLMPRARSRISTTLGRSWAKLCKSRS